MNRIIASALLCLLAVGCGSSSKATQSSAAEMTRDPGASAQVATEEPTRDPGKVEFPSGASQSLSVLEFGLDGQLMVGFSNGTLAKMRVLSRTGKVTSVSSKGVAPIAISPDGSLVVLNSSPPVAVNDTGALILNMNSVSSVEDAAFARSEFSLYVGSPDGTIRIWGQAHSFEEPKSTEKMEDYLNRQASDFKIKMKPLRGPLHATDSGLLLFADDTGVVSLWNPRKPSESRRIMKLEGTARSLSTSGNDVVTTSSTNQLKVGRLDPPSYLPWSRGETAAYAATSEFLPDKFIELSEGRLRARTISTGDEEWSVALPSGEPCGVSVSPDGNLAAVCVDNYVATFATSDGTWDTVLWHDGEKVRWETADGRPIKLP